jgi:hypothetical protein
MRKTLISVLICVCVTVGNSWGQQQSAAHNSERACKKNPKIVSQCFQIHGRAFTSDGTPDLRIWRVGTKRIVGVTASATADDAEDPIAPDNLLRALGTDQHFVFGDFEVCPFTPEREGQMQMVCVERAENLVTKPYDYGTKYGTKP